MKIEVLKRHFERRLLPVTFLRRLVNMNILTAEQFKEITGQDY